MQSWLCEKVVFARICTHKGVGPSTHMRLPLKHTCAYSWNTRVFALEHPNVGGSTSETAHWHTHTHAYVPVQTRVCTDVTYSCAVSMSKHSLAQRIDINVPVPQGAVHCRVCQHVQSWLVGFSTRAVVAL